MSASRGVTPGQVRFLLLVSNCEGHQDRCSLLTVRTTQDRASLEVSTVIRHVGPVVYERLSSE